MPGPHDFTFVPQTGLPVRGSYYDFTLVSHLSPSKLWMLSVLWPHDFTLVSHMSRLGSQ